jgi:hypothetical protein
LDDVPLIVRILTKCDHRLKPRAVTKALLTSSVPRTGLVLAGNVLAVHSAFAAVVKIERQLCQQPDLPAYFHLVKQLGLLRQAQQLFHFLTGSGGAGQHTMGSAKTRWLSGHGPSVHFQGAP